MSSYLKRWSLYLVQSAPPIPVPRWARGRGRSRRVRSFAVLAVGFLWASTGVVQADAQLTPSPSLHDAYFAWDEGRYPESMEAYLEVLRGPGGEELVGEIARLTGEVHPVRAVDDDGQGVSVSPDGTQLLWSRELNGGWVTRVEPISGGARVELMGAPGVFAGPGTVAYLDPQAGSLRIRDLTGGGDRAVPLPVILPIALASAADASDLFLTAAKEGAGDRLHIVHVPGSLVDEDGTPGEVRVLELGAGHAADPMPVAGGRFLVFSRPTSSPVDVPSGAEPTETPDPGLGILDLETGEVIHMDGSSPSVSADGSFLAFIRSSDDDPMDRVMGVPLTAEALSAPGGPAFRVLLESEASPADPAVSPSGDRVALELRPHRSREIFMVPADGSQELRQVSREVQHDRFPQWISDDLLLAMKGEFRHRRAYVYDLVSGENYRLSHNNTLRTIAPEYEWVAHPQAEGVAVVAERDGDTIDPRRALWWVDLTRTVTREDVEARLEANLEREQELLNRGRESFAPIAEEAAEVAAQVSVPRIYNYAAALYSFGSKFFTEPGNQEAIQYLAETLESWGYDVELQWWEPRGVATANVVATLPGTVDPDLVYVISSHFDSVLRSPGADDNSSGTTALLEAARVLKDHPREATIQFAFLSAEEAGLLGAREFVRRAQEDAVHISGVLNNDMIGWTRSHRLDNTIRYSNPGIMEIQHAAAHFFSDLITYDALYYRGTDAAVFYDAYGDVVGGIGSYPVLGNPNYHQPTDELETINQRLVAEVSRTTVASIMLLADSPARLVGLQEVEAEGSATAVQWEPAPESGVTGYRVQGRSAPQEEWRELGVASESMFRLPETEDLSEIRVRAVRENGTEGWDWAYLSLP